MVCLPCFILPVFVIIYVRFIQPLIYRFVPDRWKCKIDSWLYPTCPLDLDEPQQQKNQENKSESPKKCPMTAGSDKKED